jgi:hypothetical protein
MYTLILILGVNVQTVGSFTSAQECQAHVEQFVKQDIKAACVRQQSPEEAMDQAKAFFNQFQQIVSKMQ